jgi:hypothetical protein
MKFVRTLATLSLAVLAATHAHATDPAAVMQSTGNMVATPNPLRWSVSGDLTQYGTVSVVNNGAGFASNLAVTMTRTAGRQGIVQMGTDTCNGATLAPGGTCSMQFQFDPSCPTAENDNFVVTITSSNAPTLTVPIYAQSKGGFCQ